jgi:hypothetical protein
MNKILILESGLKHSSQVLEPYLKRLHVFLSEGNQIVDIRNPLTFDERTFFSYDQVIFVFQSTLDSIPSSVLEIFERLETASKNHQEIYSIILCDEYEPEKCTISARIIKKWCDREALIYKGTLNIGASLLMMNKRRFVVANALKKFSKKIIQHEEVKMHLTYGTLSNFMKKGNLYWEKQIKKKQKEIKKMSK